MENALVALSNELAATVEKASQSVVAVHGRPRVASSGVIWGAGVIVTAEHTLRRDDELRVTLHTGQTVAATIAGRDPGTDLAVLKVDAAEAPALTLLPDAELKPGSLVLAVGRSSDTGVNATLGVISAVSGAWHTWRGGRIDRFVRLDVGLYPGGSGGAVVDAQGRFAGIATGGLSRTSALAVPAVTIERVVNDLLQHGHVSRGYLGVGLQPVALPAHLKNKLGISAKVGLIVLSVEPEAPAGQAGVVIGDILLALDDKPVADTEDVQATLGRESVGKSVKASIMRGGELAELTIAIGERPHRRA
jgi:S1-C subfamily serine protease